MEKIKVLLIAAFVIISMACMAQENQNISKNSKQGGSDDMDKMMNQFMGTHKKELLQTWGMPNSIISDGDGGEILKFEDIKKANINGNVVVAVHTYLWYFDQDKKAYYWKYDMVLGRE